MYINALKFQPLLIKTITEMHNIKMIKDEINCFCTLANSTDLEAIAMSNMFISISHWPSKIFIPIL